MPLAVFKFAGPGADISLRPLKSLSDVTLSARPERTTNCSIRCVAFWPFMATYIATPGFFMPALRPSSVTSTTETSIWLVIRAATFGGPPKQDDRLRIDIEFLQVAEIAGDEVGSDELTGNTPTFTLSAACVPPDKAKTIDAMKAPVKIRRVAV